MLNDWVLHNGIAKRVDVIWSRNSVSLCNPNVTWGSIYADRFDTSEISPIPLTPELLEKNGFVPAKKYRTHHYQQGDIYIAVGQWGRITVSSRGERRGNRMNIDCQYLHQLQHALRDCNINIQINP